MTAKRIEEYRHHFQKTRFFSQFAAFLISVFSLLSIFEIIRGVYYEFFFDPSTPYYGFTYFRNFAEETGLYYAITFQLLVTFIFTFKFVLSFFKSKKVFWLNQIVWLFGFIILLSYWLFSRPSSEVNFHIYSTYPEVSFKHASGIFGSLGLSYLFLSPLRKVIAFIVVFIKFK